MKKSLMYLFVLLAALSFQSCDDKDAEEMVKEKEIFTLYGEEALSLPYVAGGDVGTYQGYNRTNIFLATADITQQNNLAAGSNVITLFFSHSADNLVANNFTSIESSDNSTADLILEGAKFTYDYDPTVEGPSAIDPVSGSVNLISYDEANGQIEIEYIFAFSNGKTLEGYYKGDYNFLGVID